jgi:hypothetical protein
VITIDRNSRPCLTASPGVVDLAEAEGFELSLCLTLAMTRRADSGELRF